MDVLCRGCSIGLVFLTWGNLSQSATAEKNKDLKEEHHNLSKLQENISGKSLR